MAEGGGRDTEPDLDGHPGAYSTIMSRNAEGKPCASCGHAILKASCMGRKCLLLSAMSACVSNILDGSVRILGEQIPTHIKTERFDLEVSAFQLFEVNANDADHAQNNAGSMK